MYEKLDTGEVKTHWEEWAKKFGTNLRATTKNKYAKKIELHALGDSINSLNLKNNSKILEIGCGNGHNIFFLAKTFPKLFFHGIDYVKEMIISAKEISKKESSKNISFQQMDVFDINEINQSFDLIFSVRCLINLGDSDKQKFALSKLMQQVKGNGYFIFVENTEENHSKLNQLRKLSNQEIRPQAKFNHFLKKNEVIEHMQTNGFELVLSESISSLHDLLLYVVNPLNKNGEIDYDDELIEVAADLDISMRRNEIKMLRDIGQNHLYIFQNKNAT